MQKWIFSYFWNIKKCVFALFKMSKNVFLCFWKWTFFGILTHLKKVEKNDKESTPNPCERPSEFARLRPLRLFLVVVSPPLGGTALSSDPQKLCSGGVLCVADGFVVLNRHSKGETPLCMPFGVFADELLALSTELLSAALSWVWVGNKCNLPFFKKPYEKA